MFKSVIILTGVLIVQLDMRYFARDCESSVNNCFVVFIPTGVRINPP